MINNNTTDNFINILVKNHLPEQNIPYAISEIYDEVRNIIQKQRKEQYFITREEAEAVIEAWDSLQGGRCYNGKQIETWLAQSMAPAINEMRQRLKSSVVGIIELITNDKIKELIETIFIVIGNVDKTFDPTTMPMEKLRFLIFLWFDKYKNDSDSVMKVQ